MEKNVRLKIILPDRIYKEQETCRVIIPGNAGDMTVLPERAPTIATLRKGYVKVLDEQNNVTDKYFITGGLADIADNICTISSESVIPEDYIGQYGINDNVNWRVADERRTEVFKRYRRKLKNKE